ncbi:unnamed protein product, partial [Ixodes hexagonus]
RFLAAEPHLSGTDRSERVVADYILNKYKEHGLDTFEKVPYDILHQYPDPNNPNKVQLLAGDGTILMDAALHEKQIPGIKTEGVPAYLSYAKPGTVEADVIFVNHGTHNDFDELQANNIDVKGHICLSRYGGGHRGNKVRDLSCPGTYAHPPTPQDIPPGINPEEWARHDTSGTVTSFVATSGSLLAHGRFRTVNTPAGDTFADTTRAYGTPRSCPLSSREYQDVMSDLNIRQDMTSANGISRRRFDWLAATGHFFFFPKQATVRLVINSKFEVKTCYNIIGTIKGAIEPDRYSITGTHHDAWVYGAEDPSSATAALLELTRLLGNELKRGWRPRRSIVFGIWAAEEMAIAGSQEWVEDKFLLLNRGAVGYSNVDNCVSGTMFFAYASPAFHHLIIEATKVVPFDDKQFLYDIWYDFSINKMQRKDLVLILPHGGADNNAFNNFAGIPAVAFTFRPDGYGWGSYPSYHTAYETLHLYETFYDPEYKYMALCTQLNGLLTLTLAESELLPYNFSRVAFQYQTNLKKIMPMETKMTAHGVSLDWLKKETDGFEAAALKWHHAINAERNSMSESRIRMLNDRMLLIERAFLKLEGIKDRPTLR